MSSPLPSPSQPPALVAAFPWSALAFCALTLGLLATVLIDEVGVPHTLLKNIPGWVNQLAIGLLTLPALIGLSAACELTSHRPSAQTDQNPRQLPVPSGLYSYVANPLQLSLCLLFLGWGLYLQNSPVLIAAALIVIFCVGQSVVRHTAHPTVRPWLPRWRPWHPSLATAPVPSPAQPAPSPARVYFAETCLTCSAVASWVRRHQPVALEIHAAEDHPRQALHRMSYDPMDGSPEESGMPAFGRVLEHIHLGYALIGFTIRLPLIRLIVQIFADAVGAGPREIARRADRPMPTPAPAPVAK